MTTTTDANPDVDTATDPTHAIALQTLDDILTDFGLSRPSTGAQIKFVNSIPPAAATRSQTINLSLIGAIPALANALAASQILALRNGSGSGGDGSGGSGGDAGGGGGGPQTITLDLARAHNYIDPDIGMTPTLNGQEIPLDVLRGNPFLNSIFATRDGKFVVLSAVYVDLVYQWTALLRCGVQIDDVREAVARWDAQTLESVCADVGMPMAVVRTEAEWAATQAGAYLASAPIVPVTGIATTTPALALAPRPRRALEGIKVLCVTHAIAGPAAGRTLAEHGASVLQIMYTHGYEHAFVYTYANLGSASARLNLHKGADRDRLWALVRDAHVWIDSYREGGLAKFGFDDDALLRENRGLVVSHVRCFGAGGPWAARPGFDMQGSAASGLMFACSEDGGKTPAWPPGAVINDYTTGYFGALAIQAALMRRIKEGGSAYVLAPSLTGTAMSILRLFKTSRFGQAMAEAQGEALPPLSFRAETSLGVLRMPAPLPQMSGTPLRYEPVVLETMGSSRPEFPGHGDGYDVDGCVPMKKHDVLVGMWRATGERLARLREVGIEGLRRQKEKDEVHARHGEANGVEAV